MNNKLIFLALGYALLLAALDFALDAGIADMLFTPTRHERRQVMPGSTHCCTGVDASHKAGFLPWSTA